MAIRNTYPIELRVLDGSGWRTAWQDKVLGMLDDDSVREHVNEIILEEVTPYVPMGGNSPREAWDPDPHPGYLRRSARIYGDTIEWQAPYAHYQYAGYVYRKNIKIFIRDADGNKISKDAYKFRSPAGVLKRKSHDQLKYYTPGTGRYWYSLMMKSRGTIVNNRISAYLRQELRRRGISVS